MRPWAVVVLRRCDGLAIVCLYPVPHRLGRSWGARRSEQAAYEVLSLSQLRKSSHSPNQLILVSSTPITAGARYPYAAATR
jgi:hypothetical protein